MRDCREPERPAGPLDGTADPFADVWVAIIALAMLGAWGVPLDPEQALTQFRFATERCSLESFIKEGKGSFQHDFLPCKERNANEAYLMFVQLTYNLAILFKLRTAPKGVNRWTMKTLRERVLCICGNLRRQGTGWLLSLPAWWPYQTVFRQMELRGRLAFGL